MNYFSNNKAQGTIEYLVIISVIVVIALALVTFLLAQGDTAQEISKSSDKASNVIGKGGISVTGSVTSSSGDTVISLKNNSGETLTITNLSATNEQGKESSLDYNEDVLPGYEIPLILVDTNLACPCIDGKPTTCKIKITFVGSSGLVKTETLTIKSDSCVQTINYFTLNYTAGTGGSIIGNTTQKILPGKNGSTVTAQPNEGYVFSEWSDGSTNPTRKETNVDKNNTITAEFKLNVECTLDEDCENESLICNNNICVPKEDGTINYPWIITNCIELQNINEYLDGNYILGNDIDCTDTINWNDGKGFRPIGNLYKTAGFKGNFDGKNYKIKNLYINTQGPLDGRITGLFSINEISGKIKNIELVDVNITGTQIVGGLTGQNSGLINNINITGRVKAIDSTSIVGGITGKNTGIIHSVSSNNITQGEEVVGGIAGWNSNNGEIYHTYSFGITNGTNSVGGIVGHNTDGAKIYSVFNNGTTTGISGIGGIVGWNSAHTHNVYFNGTVIGENTVGGIAGINYSSISKSYSIGNVNGIEKIGGIIGENGVESDPSSNTTFLNCFSNALVTGDNFTGGLIGKNNVEVVIFNSYWDQNLTGQNNCYYKETSLWETTYYYEGDFDCIPTNNQAQEYYGTNGTTKINNDGNWTSIDNNYPLLKWQTEWVINN